MQVITPSIDDVASAIRLTEPDHYQIILTTEGQTVNIVLLHEVKITQSQNFYIDILHQASHTHAKTTMKSVVHKKGSVILQGKIIIAKDAVGCTSFLTQRVLLLDPSARAEAIPELEILNNDVRCSHAASISGVDQEQMHYLMSRGMSEKKASSVIAAAFLSV